MVERVESEGELEPSAPDSGQPTGDRRAGSRGRVVAGGLGRDASAAPQDRVVVCGLDELSVCIVEELYLSGVEVVVVDDQPERRLLGLLESWSVRFVEATPSSPVALAAAGAAKALAVVCVTDSDLRNLETALVASGIRPGLRVVAQMTNTALARELQAVGIGSILDVADLASPALVQACLGDRHLEIDLGGEHFIATQVLAEFNGTLRSLYGDLVPIAVVAGDRAGGEVELCPGRDHHVLRGDRVMVLGSPGEMAQVNVVPTDAPPVRRTSLASVVVSALSAAWRFTDRKLRLTVTALLVLVASSSLLLQATFVSGGRRGIGLLNAVYFTVETVATIGFGNGFAAQAPWLRVFGIVLIILGALLLATIFALVTNLLVSRAVIQELGHSRAVRMRRHVVVVGLGSIGVRVVERLRSAGREVVVVERDEHNRHLAQVRALKVPVIIGDATLPSTLDLANVRSASAVAALTSDDLVNLETALSLRAYLAGFEVDPPVVLRVFDRAFARTVEASFGLRNVHSTAALAAPWFVGAVLGLDILLSFAVEQESLLVGRLTVAPSGGLAGLRMQDLSARLRVLAIRRADGGALEHPPRRDTRFRPGDEAYLIGPYAELLAVLRRDAAVPPLSAATS